MQKLRFFRAFVFLKHRSSSGKNLSDIEEEIHQLRENIDFNYNTTQLITNYIRRQDNRITLLSEEREVSPLLVRLRTKLDFMLCTALHFTRRISAGPGGISAGFKLHFSREIRCGVHFADKFLGWFVRNRSHFRGSLQL